MFHAASVGLGGYAYLANRKTETLGDAAATAARITVNGYGALVLNTSRALFVDIDTSDDGENPPVSELPGQIGDALGRHHELRFRAYRTRGGWRLLCANEQFDPASAETESLLVDLGADSKYIVLCRVQQSFRARLTPKPWRARYRPREIPPGEGVSRADLQRYIDRTWRYATARYVGGAGRDETPPEMWPIVEYHDRWTQATSEKPLA